MLAKELKYSSIVFIYTFFLTARTQVPWKNFINKM